MGFVRHKVFISYHHADDEEVRAFVNTFDDERDVFIARALGVDIESQIINSGNTDYVMKRIRDLYLKDSTVTLVMIGKQTWSRRYVDWELQSSLRQGKTAIPNGLVGIVLPSAGKKPTPPPRLQLNLKGEDSDQGYARWHWYPPRKDLLRSWIEDAFCARFVRAGLIENPRDRFKYNRSCS